MREAYFLKKNADKWQQYEAELKSTVDPDALAAHFIEVTDDLAYAKTFYPKSNTTQYLNGLASRFHLHIYRNKKEKGSRVFSFWRFELPYLFRQYHKQLFWAFVIFSVFVFVGVLSALYDHQFIRLILGDGYVNMTMENIEKGDPFGVYKQTGPVMMFIQIGWNNLMVAFMIFVSGITAGIITGIMLMRNSIMLGSFIAFFFSKQLGGDAILAVFIHGTLEILGMVVEACAGFIIAKAILFPGTYSRKAALGKAVKDGLKIIMGMVPIILLAAFLESFVTRHYKEMPLWLNLMILVGSLLFMIWYFIVYPIRLQRRMKKSTSLNQSEDDQNFLIWKNKKSHSGR